MRADETALLTFSPQGLVLLQRLQKAWPRAQAFAHQDLEAPGCIPFARIYELMATHFHSFRHWVCIAPCGVVVRAIAPSIGSKLSDPAVVVVDAGGRHAVSLLSGHEGGANALATEVSNVLEAEPVISTTTEAVKTLIAGIGCRRGTPAQAILDLLDMALAQAGKSREDLRFLASAALKADEAGLLECSELLGIPLRFIPHSQIIQMAPLLPERPTVQERVGLPGVAEPAALLAGRKTTLCLHRLHQNGVTIALAQENCWSWA